MNFLVHILTKIHFYFIKRYVLNRSTGICNISKKAHLKGVILTGNGKINIADDANLFEEVVLNGNITIDRNTTVHNAKLQGNISLAENCKIIGPVHMLSNSNISIGRFTSITGPNTDLFAEINPIEVGNFSSIARNVSIQEYNHDFSSLSTYFVSANVLKEKNTNINSRGPVSIGHDVWVGTQTVILSGAKIGHGAVIAANSTVTGEVPPYAIAGGNPAKVIKYRFEPDIIERLLELNWWNWDIEKIRKNKFLFEGELTLEKLNNLNE